MQETKEFQQKVLNIINLIAKIKKSKRAYRMLLLAKIIQAIKYI